MFLVPKNAEELRRLYESDTPVLAFAFERRVVEDWAPEHSHLRGQLFALTRGLLIVEAGSERWMFPSQRCAWIPPNCRHAAGSVGGVAGSMVHLSAGMCRGLPKMPCMSNSSELLFAIVHRILGWDLRQPLNPAKKHLIATLRDEIRQPDQQPLRLTIPREERLARVADALLEDVGDDRALDAWAHVAGMARRTFLLALVLLSLIRYKAGIKRSVLIFAIPLAAFVICAFFGVFVVDRFLFPEQHKIEFGLTLPIRTPFG
jgi:hypothetical protein